MQSLASACARCRFDDSFVSTMKGLCTHRSRIGFWKGCGETRKFTPLTNFAFKFTKFVKAPDELKKYAGYIVKVTQMQGETTVEGLVGDKCKVIYC